LSDKIVTAYTRTNTRDIITVTQRKEQIYNEAINL